MLATRIGLLIFATIVDIVCISISLRVAMHKLTFEIVTVLFTYIGLLWVLVCWLWSAQSSYTTGQPAVMSEMIRLAQVSGVALPLLFHLVFVMRVYSNQTNGGTNGGFK